MSRDRERANKFYSTRAWKNLRDAYVKQAGGLCERCAEQGLIVPGEIVHHVEHLDDVNVNDPNVALSTDNLQLLCRRCHAEVHDAPIGKRKRYVVDEYGKVSARKE